MQPINFSKPRWAGATSALNDFGNRWCKGESVECNAMKEWKLNIFKIVDKRIKIYSQNTNLLPHNNNEKFTSFKSKENIHKKEVGPYRGFGY